MILNPKYPIASVSLYLLTIGNTRTAIHTYATAMAAWKSAARRICVLIVGNSVRYSGLSNVGTEFRIPNAMLDISSIPNAMAVLREVTFRPFSSKL